MDPNKRRQIVDGIAYSFAAAMAIFGIIRKIQMNEGLPFSPAILLGSMVAVGTISGLGFLFGKGIALLVVPRATIPCPQCGGNEARPARKSLFSKNTIPNKCPKCKHQWI